MPMLDPTTVLLAVAMILLTAATTLSLLVRRHPPATHPLFLALSVAFVALVGLLFVDAGGAGGVSVVTEQTRVVSLFAATHRRLLLLLPILLVLTSQWILSVYGQRLSETHARDYRNVVSFSSGISLIAVIVIAIESMI